MRCLDRPSSRGLLLLAGLLVILGGCRAQPPSTAVDTEPDASQEALLPDSGSLEEMERLSKCGPLNPPPEVLPEGILVTIRLDRTRYSPGEGVGMTLTLENLGDGPIEAKGNLAVGDYWVQDGLQVVWMRSYRSRRFGEIVEDVIQSGEKRVDRTVWDQRLCNPGVTGETFLEGPPPPGVYTARALWRRYHVTPGTWWSNPVTFEIR